MGIKARLAARGWSVTVNSDWGTRHRFLNWLRLNTYHVRGDYTGVHLAIAGLNLCVTKYARARA